MAQSSATTVAEYLRTLPSERRTVVSEVRRMIRRHLPAGYVERMASGMIAYEIPLARYPDTYNGSPLCYVGLAAQRDYYALYLIGCYQDPAEAARLRDAFRERGRRLDMGKSCLRFKRLDELPLEAIGATIAGTTPERFISQYETGRQPARKR